MKESSLSEFLDLSLVSPPFNLTQPSPKSPKVLKSLSVPRHKHPVPTPKSTEEPFYLHENHPHKVTIPSPSRQITPKIRSLTQKILRKSTCKSEKRSKEPQCEFIRREKVNVVETERYRYNLLYFSHRLRPEHHLFRAMKQEYRSDEANKKTELRAEILFSRLLEGMRGLLASNNSHEKREIPPFMTIKRTYVRPLQVGISLSYTLKKRLRRQQEAEMHHNDILAVCFEAVDVENSGRIQGWSLLCFLNNFGLEVDGNGFECMLGVYLGTSLEGEVEKKPWLELLRNHHKDTIFPVLSADFPFLKPANLNSTGTKSNDFLCEIEREVTKSNHLFRYCKQWWSRLSAAHRGNISLQVVSSAVSSQYNLPYEDVISTAKRLFAKGEVVNEARFLALLYPCVLGDALARLGERLFEGWKWKQSQSFALFAAEVNRRCALETLDRK